MLLTVKLDMLPVKELSVKELSVTVDIPSVVIELVCIVDVVINLALTLMVEIDAAFIRLANPVVKLAVTDERLDVKTEP